MPFTHNLNPTLVAFGPFEIRFYGIVYALGFLALYFWLDYARKKGDLKLSRDDIDTFILYEILGVILGARIVHILFWEPAYYFSHPLDILMIWKGGLAFHGGLTGGILAGYLFCKKKKVPFMQMADLTIIPATFALALGRIANFINGEIWGTVTNVPWCVYFQNVQGCRHPVQIYGAIKRFFIFGILVILYTKNNKKHKDGFIFWNFVAMMGAGRFILDFWREDARLFGLAAGQYFSFVMTVVAIYVLYKYYRNNPTVSPAST